jgi:hypothetical protein
MRMLLPWIRTLMVPMSSDFHPITCNTDSYLRELLLAPQCESNISHHYEIVQQSTELVRSVVDPGNANPEITSKCLYA